MTAEFKRMQTTYGFTIVDANRTIDAVFTQLKRRIESVLEQA